VLVEELEDEELEEELPEVDEVLDDVEDGEPESEEPDVDDAESDFADTVLLPVDRLSLR
jgi:hypothetical protein